MTPRPRPRRCGLRERDMKRFGAALHPYAPDQAKRLYDFKQASFLRFFLISRASAPKRISDKPRIERGS